MYVCAWKGMLMLRKAVAVSSDWALASLPTVFMWKMQMSIKLKVCICILMGMGFLWGFSLQMNSLRRASTLLISLLMLYSSGVCAIMRTVLEKDSFATDVTCRSLSSAGSLIRLIMTISGCWNSANKRLV